MVLPKSVRAVTTAATKFNTGYETDEWFVFPREREGNEYAVNWSLVGDGVTPVADAFRNARPQLLFTRSGANVKNITDRLEAKKPSYEGEYKLVVAGAGLSNDDFEEIFADTKSQLSSGVDLFVEDLAVGSFSPESIGVRIITDNANVALQARTFLFQQPPREVNFRARAKGWNLDERWRADYGRKVTWTGDHYTRMSKEEAAKPAPGERPIVVYVSNTLESNEIAVQYLHFQSEVVGANIVFGKEASINGLMHAIGEAAALIGNQSSSAGVILPSSVFTKGQESYVLLGAADAFGLDNPHLYGRYYNNISAESISAVFNGHIVPVAAGAKVAHANTSPFVVVQDKASVTVAPHNKTFPAKTIVIVDSTNALGGKTTLTKEEAVAHVAKTYKVEHKEAALTAIFANASVHVVNKAADAAKHVK